MHALIIEQDAFTVIMIENVLLELGYTSFDFAASAEEAVAHSERRCPDLITSDLRLGTGDGIDTVRNICSVKPIPVVFVTSTGWEVRGRDPGLAVVQKPFVPQDLKEAVGRATAAV